MKKGYRIPKIEEFVQDFEFEYLMKTGGSHFNGFHLSKEEVQEQIEKNRWSKEEWISIKVWWKPRTQEEAKQESIIGECSVTWFISEFDCPINLKGAIEDKQVRVKI